jgi:sugar lactone lactonase YvrE
MKKPIIAICMMALLVSLTLAQAPAPAPAAAAAPLNPNYEINKAWAQLPADLTPWNQSTSSITADGKGNVVVLVRAVPFFRMFTRDGKFVKAWGTADDFSGTAHSIMFDPEGNIWTTDAQNGHVVQKYDASGKLLMTLGKKGMAGDDTSTDLFNAPNAVAIAPNGDIYVSDGYINSRVVHFDKTGKFIRIIGGKKGSEPGQLQLPHGVVIDSRGRIIVGDSDNRRITVFDKDGKFVETWPFQSRGGMFITSDDTLYVSEVATGAISVIKDGKLIETIGGLGRPHGLTVDTDGTIYAAEALGRVVMKITKKK